jgi:hypothetical protein
MSAQVDAIRLLADDLATAARKCAEQERALFHAILPLIEGGGAEVYDVAFDPVLAAHLAEIEVHAVRVLHSATRHKLLVFTIAIKLGPLAALAVRRLSEAVREGSLRAELGDCDCGICTQAGQDVLALAEAILARERSMGPG